MSAKQLVRLAAILGVLLLVWGAAALARRREAAPPSDAFRLPRITRSEVDTVTISRPKDTTLLARRDSSTWTVNGHAASSNAVGDLLTALADSAPSSELVAEQKRSQPGLGVDDSAGSKVRIKGKGKTLADLVLGKRSQDFSGGYIRRAGQESTYVVRGQLIDVLNRSPDDWREHRIASIAADSVARIEIIRGHKSYALVRNEKSWKLASGAPADSTKMGDLLTAYSSVDATGFASPAQADSAHFGQPDRRVRLARKNGTPLLTLLFDSTAAGFWVRPDTSKTIYRIESWTADRLAPADTTALRKR
ncbi:MAG: DUF4340 domain-containing protein [Gemmatimonadales bacterium]